VAANSIIEEGSDFTPGFDSGGLITTVAQDADTGQILMVAHMNKEALEMTIKTGYAVYFSRSRRKLWKKGEQSGHFQKVQQILTDCDQDCLVLKVKIEAGQCHVGYKSCFYRELKQNAPNKLAFIAQKTYNAGKIYGK
jgi:phosphoribosyl-AMP cyclohydrolase